MDAPQSRDEIDPIETAIRQQIDDQLRIRWNPRSYVTRPGAFDASGAPIGPSHEGRWEVVRELDGQLAVIYQVRFDGEGNEAYRAVGWWLLDFLRKWDRANRFWLEEMTRMYGEDEAAERALVEQAEGEQREHLDRVARDDLKMSQWIGRGFGTLASTNSTSTPEEAAV